MIILKETTDWKTPNHIYFVDDTKSRLLGYIPAGTTNKIMFDKSMFFDKKQRMFKTLKSI